MIDDRTPPKTPSPRGAPRGPAAKRPVLRFVATLALLMIVFNALFYTYISNAPFFHAYLAVNAQAAGVILSLLGSDVTVTGDALTSHGFSLGIKRGCDAIQASAFFIFLVIASPSPVKLLARVSFIVVGTVALLVLNLVRILTLYYAGVHCSPAVFDFLHVDLWQAVFIFLPLFLWVVWTRRAEKSKAKKPDVSV